MQGVMRESHDEGLMFIGGAHGRCGTTLVKRLVATHPDVSPVTHGESRLLEFVAECWPNLVHEEAYSPGAGIRALTRLRQSVTEQLGDSTAIRNALDALACDLGAKEIRLVGRARGLLPAPQSDGAVAASMSRFVARACRAAALEPEARRLVEKTPSNAQYILTINRLFAKSPILVMVRNPLAVALSHTRRPWGPTDPVEAATYTAAYYRRWREVEERASNLLVLRHEDLVAQPERCMREVLAHLGLTSDNRVLQRALQEIRPSEDRVQDIGPAVLRAMLAELEHEMDAFGYPPVHLKPSFNRIPLTKPALPPLRRVVPLLGRVWSSSHVTNSGPMERAFEEALEDRFGWTDPVLTSSGTSAISLLLRSLDLPEGEIIVPAFSFPALSQAIAGSGFRPVGVDIEPDFLGLDPNEVELSIRDQTVAIFAAHTFGMPADIDALEKVAEARSLPLVFDAAPAVGVRWRDRPLSDFGAGSAFSFHATKTLTTIEGGAAVSNDAEVRRRMRELRNFDLGSPGPCSPRGTNAKCNDVLAAIGLAGLGDLGDQAAERETLHARYQANFQSVPHVQVLRCRPETISTFPSLVVRLRSQTGEPLADKVERELAVHSIDTRRYFNHRYQVEGLLRPHPTPEADRAVEDVLCLPLWAGLGASAVDRICSITVDAVK